MRPEEHGEDDEVETFRPLVEDTDRAIGQTWGRFQVGAQQQ